MSIYDISTISKLFLLPNNQIVSISNYITYSLYSSSIEELEIHYILPTLSNTIRLAMGTTSRCRHYESTLDRLFLVSLDYRGVLLYYISV